jgi:uncharacterized protein YqeY
VPDTDLSERLRADLKTAMRERDQAAVRALRTALAAFANAEAPPLDGKGPEASVGLVDHDRLELSDDQRLGLLRREVDEREAAAAEYDAIGQGDAADDVRAEVLVLRRYL